MDRTMFAPQIEAPARDYRAAASMGGFTALRYALRHPERLSGLVPIDSGAEAYGEADRSLSIDAAERMADAIPDADLVRVPESGHTSTVERPEVVTEAVASFLEDVHER